MWTSDDHGGQPAYTGKGDERRGQWRILLLEAEDLYISPGLIASFTSKGNSPGIQPIHSSSSLKRMALLPWLHCLAKAQPKPKKFMEGSPEKHELGNGDFLDGQLWGYAMGSIVDCSL